MTPIRFTVITPCLDAAHTIERTLCSVIDQGYDRLQYIVIDRGSNDETANILKLYENDITWLSQQGATRAQAMATAMSIATGDVIAIVDDLLLPDALSEISRRMSLPGSPDWFVGQMVQMDSHDMEVGRVTPTAPASLARFLMHDSGVLPLGAMFMRRSMLASVGGIDATLEQAHDYDLCCRLLVQGYRPTMTPLAVTGRWEKETSLPAASALQQGLEYITIARRYASHLTLREQAALWRNCDERQRIYALAEAELSPSEARKQLWARLRSHPWWIMNPSVRHTLMHGVSHPAPAVLRPAA